MFEQAISREPEEVIISRSGSVLGKKTVLKSDHFPGCQNKKLLPHVRGAPNYRQVGTLPVYGVAIPTVEGIREVLHLVGCTKVDGRKVLWHNMREEPVVYINGRPFVLREVEKPFTNLEYTGIDRQRVEQMEMRLKEDVSAESARYNNKIMVSDELPDGQMVDLWEPIGPDSIQTPLEVYESLQAEGYPVSYERVPVTDEKSPKERDFDLLVQNLSEVEESVALVFNCQMGRGRTTTGMVVATLVHLRRTSMSVSPAYGGVLGEGKESEESFRKGEYKVIRSLTRVLEGGVACKKEVDAVIDKCSAMQNLREAILQYRNNILKQADEKKRQAALSNFVEYLERYYFLICFAVYLAKSDPASLRQPEQGFRKWMKDRPELYSILRRLLHKDPMGALDYKPPSALSQLKRAQSGSANYDGKADMEQVMASRSGDVLGKQTCLKSDHCPGCQSTSLTELLEGAPNFRAVPGFPVYGAANPTLHGIRAVLKRVGGGCSARKVVWHNMREEPTVFINGAPFVLREVERPFKNILEYSGIDRERVEKMEARLKEDVLKEAAQYGGQVMVNHETADGEIFDAWENVLQSPFSVQTPLEAYQSLQLEGFNVEYVRVPITDGKAPQSVDFDSLARKIADSDPGSIFVFNCQMGRGRTTTGTVIATLVLTRCMLGRPLKPLSHPCTPKDSSDDSEEEQFSLDPGSAADLTEMEAKHSLAASQPTQPQADNPFAPALPSKPAAGLRRTSVERSAPFTLEDIATVRKFTRLMERGSEVRSVLDSVIDRCASMQNIRRAILHYRKAFNNQDLDARVRQSALSRGIEYLERYCLLIAFSAYLESDAFFPGQHWEGGDAVEQQQQQQRLSFREWIKRRPDINQTKWSMRLRPARVFTIPEVDARAPGAEADSDSAEAVHEAVVRSRTGSVLGRCSILKLSLFPRLKLHSQSLQERTGLTVPGAHNVYAVEGFPVFSMATPTEEGMRNVLTFLGAGAGAAGGAGCTVMVTDLREEAVVYVKGKPYVLREIEQPVSTLKHVGIEGPTVEKLEQRMKDDVLEEAARMGWRFLLHKEWLRQDHASADVRGFWEAVAPGDVLTPAQMYRALAAMGFRVDYRRVPLTRERDPHPADIDAIQRRMDSAPEGAVFLFVSHTGFGGIAYAMALVCLRLHAHQLLQHHTVATTSSAGSSSSAPSTPTKPSPGPFLLAGLTSPPSSRVSPLPAHTPLSPGGGSSFFPLLSPPSPRTQVRGVYPAASRTAGLLLSDSVRTDLFGKSRGAESQALALARGEYRDVLSLARVLVHGPKSKFEVDAIVDRLVAVGSIREDILEHKQKYEALSDSAEHKEKKAAELDAGLKALRRYCYLIVFRAYLASRIAETGSTQAGDKAFSEWMKQRPELGHMVNRVKLQ